MSRIGSNTARTAGRGFTLVEIMVSLAIPSLGIIVIYEAFFKVSNEYGYAYDRLLASYYMDEVIWDLQDVLVREEAIDENDVDLTKEIMGKRLILRGVISPGAEDESIYGVTLKFEGSVGSMARTTSKSTYLLKRFY